MTMAPSMAVEVSGKTALVSAVPVTDTNAYSDGDLVGTGLSLLEDAADSGWDSSGKSGKRSGIIMSVRLTDASKQSAEVDVIFARELMASTTFTNNAAAAPHADDLTKIIGKVTIETTDYAAFSANSVGYKECAVPFLLPDGATLYAFLVTRGTPTYALLALELEVGILQD